MSEFAFPAAEEYCAFTVSEFESTGNSVECGVDPDTRDVKGDVSAIEIFEIGDLVEDDCKAWE